MSFSRSGFYKWKIRISKPSPKMIARDFDLKLIKQVHSHHPSHGYRWINTFIRNQYGVVFSDNYVHRLCKFAGIRSLAKHAKWNPPGNHSYRFNNLIWDGWKQIDKPFQVIISDMTAFRVNNAYYELTLYFDAWNKEILSYGLASRRGNIKSYFDGLNDLLSRIKKEQTEHLIILHTDQGSVYSSEAFNSLLLNFNIQRSMSRAGTPTDNPVNESLNGWIKEELFIDFNIKNSNNIPKLIENYIYYYNNIRPSYALNYKTPIQFKLESGY